MKIGNKIHKIRELKNITAKDMADRLDMTLSGYQRIERDEVSINMDRLLEISGIFDMKPEEVLSFDEKNVFNNNGDISGNPNIQSVVHISFPEEMKQLYEDKLKLQADMIALLQEKIRGLEGK